MCSALKVESYATGSGRREKHVEVRWAVLECRGGLTRAQSTDQ